MGQNRHTIESQMISSNSKSRILKRIKFKFSIRIQILLHIFATIDRSVGTVLKSNLILVIHWLIVYCVQFICILVQSFSHPLHSFLRSYSQFTSQCSLFTYYKYIDEAKKTKQKTNCKRFYRICVPLYCIHWNLPAFAFAVDSFSWFMSHIAYRIDQWT